MEKIGINVKVITNPWPELQKKITTRQVMLYGIAWGAIGAALDCYDSALRYSKERIQFGKPLAGFQLT